MLAALDIETACGVQSCPGYEQEGKCDHALHFKKNRITIIGVYDGQNYFSFREAVLFDEYRRRYPDVRFVGHRVKFDYKTLRAKGSAISPRDIVGDTQCLGACVSKKVSNEYLQKYNEERKKLNEQLSGPKHRPGTPLSLKTMAPYYLGVPAFWEKPGAHDDAAYNRLDCEYTLRLHEKLLGLAEQDGTRKFYESYLIPWQKLLGEAEYEGVLVDEVLLHTMYAEACKELKALEDGVHAVVGECFRAYHSALVADLRRDSEQRCDSFIAKRIKNPEKAEGVRLRYRESLQSAIEALPKQFNLQSSQQMLTILQWAGIDTVVEKRDKELNEWVEKEGTDKYVLKRAKVGGSNFAAQLLKYREKETEVSYLKQYIDAVVDGRIYCTFNIVGTRTGRLSSAGPNLQNVKGALRAPFIIADPKSYSIYTVDSSQIEPRVISYLTGDPDLVRLFREGRDFHNYATKKFFPAETSGTAEAEIKKDHTHLRKTAKIGDLSTIYGTKERTFQTMLLVREEMSIPLDRCREMIQSFRRGMNWVFKWKERLETQYKAGTKLHDRFGFMVQARDMSSVHMTLFNTFVQGMASRMIFHASLMAFRHFSAKRIDAKPLLWVHDEVVWRFPKGKEEYCRKVVDGYMNSYKLETPQGRVPLDVEGALSDRWTK